MTYFNNVEQKDYANVASLKKLMNEPPMTAAQYAAIMQKRREQRRMIEAARELKAEMQKNSW